MIRLRIALLFVLIILVVHGLENRGTNPVDPDKPAPTPSGKAMVMACRETSPSPPYTLDQTMAIGRMENGDIRRWITANCAADGFRAFDPDDDVSKQDRRWQSFDPKEATPPWVKTWNGRRWSKAVTFNNADELKAAIGAK